MENALKSLFPQCAPIIPIYTLPLPRNCRRSAPSVASSCAASASVWLRFNATDALISTDAMSTAVWLMPLWDNPDVQEQVKILSPFAFVENIRRREWVKISPNCPPSAPETLDGSCALSWSTQSSWSVSWSWSAERGSRSRLKCNSWKRFSAAGESRNRRAKCGRWKQLNCRFEEMKPAAIIQSSGDSLNTPWLLSVSLDT